jgi:putative hydrolase of the HAD superfamily
VSASLTTIGFDADDTLWHNERFFRPRHDEAPLDHPRFKGELAQLIERIGNTWF